MDETEDERPLPVNPVAAARRIMELETAFSALKEEVERAFSALKKEVERLAGLIDEYGT